MKNNQRALILASVASMIDQFNRENIHILLELGYEVDVVTNFEEPGNISRKKNVELKDELKNMGVTFFHVEIPRSLSKINDIIMSYKKVKKICIERKYDLVHCHSPIGGVIARIAARSIRKEGCKVIYTAHGFHFYDGAPMKNWLLFYPIEKFCARFTDVLITINNEDYERAKENFSAHKVVKIPGVGVDTDKFMPIEDSVRNIQKRNEIGVPENAMMILSVGELNDNKNQQLVIRAISKLNEDRVHYVIVGVGKNRKMLESLSYDLGLEKRIHFLGYRTDIVEINNCADMFAFPSIREGLGMASLEALACGVPVIGMNTRGIKEYVLDGKTGYLFENNVESCKKAIVDGLQMINKDRNIVSKKCRAIALDFSSERTNQIMKTEYMYLGYRR